METIGEDLRQMIRTPLAPSHVEALRAAGKVVTYPKGTIMAQPGESGAPVAGEAHSPSHDETR